MCVNFSFYPLGMIVNTPPPQPVLPSVKNFGWERRWGFTTRHLIFTISSSQSVITGYVKKPENMTPTGRNASHRKKKKITR